MPDNPDSEDYICDECGTIMDTTEWSLFGNLCEECTLQRDSEEEE